MVRRRGAPLILVFTLLSGFLLGGGTASAAQTCPGQQAPPPPQDTSERPAPGQPVPAALPVPAEPAGGTRMGECGLIYPDGSAVAPETTAASWVVQDLDTGDVVAA